jgi:formylglycine-generating enzyme required for sulfatase activity
VFRGGSWFNGADFARCAFRDYYGPAGAFSFIGFRAVLPPGQ